MDWLSSRGAHSGVLNMIETVVNLFPKQKIKAVVGGFHLVGLPVFNNIGGTKHDIEAVAKALAEYPIVRFYRPLHRYESLYNFETRVR